MARTHTHQPMLAKRTETPMVSDYCARPSRCELRAHGGIVRIDRCACGATRRTNINGEHVESGGWRLP
jgi:hypothetical protein